MTTTSNSLVIQDRAISRLEEWASAAAAAGALAQALVRTAFVPEQYRNNPADATAAILAGTEVGLSPMGALRAFDIIKGQAAPRAMTLRAILQSQGHEIMVVESTATRCLVRAKRAGSTEWQEVRWTIDRATTLGLTGKDQWRKQPQAMLVARATSEAARLVAADAIMGIGYTSEEVEDGYSEVGEQVAEAPTPKATRKIGRKAPTVDDNEPPPEPPAQLADPERQAVDADPEHADDDAATQEQTKHMFVLLNRLGLGDRDRYLALAKWHSGQDIESTNELNKAEKSTFIDYLLQRIHTEESEDQNA